MGQPSPLSTATRLATRKLAREIVESVENDEEMPDPFDIEHDANIGIAYVSRDRMQDIELALLRMAQLICEGEGREDEEESRD